MMFLSEVTEILSYNPETGAFLKNGIPTGSTVLIGPKGYKKPYIVIYIKSKKYLAHRLAMLIQSGQWPTDEVDHINGNGTDNSIKNLRAVSRQENQKNKRLRSDNPSGIAGVFFRNGKWRVRISSNGTRFNIGTFLTLLDAAAARKSAEIRHDFHELHGSVRDL